jgi:hypothetical protein
LRCGCSCNLEQVPCLRPVGVLFNLASQRCPKKSSCLPNPFAANCIQNCKGFIVAFWKGSTLGQVPVGLQPGVFSLDSIADPDDGGNVRFVPISDTSGHQATSADIRRLRPWGPRLIARKPLALAANSKATASGSSKSAIASTNQCITFSSSAPISAAR